MRKILVYSLTFIILFHSYAQDVRMEKKYQQSFSIDSDDKLDLSNKYGEIVVNSWYKDSIKIKVNVIAQAKTQDLVNREMDRVNIELRKVGNIILGSTKFDKGTSRGFFSDLVEQVDENFNRGNKIKVNYEVWVPANVKLTIENKFGDIFLSSCESNVSVNLAHGNLRGDRIENELALTQSFGKHSFEYIKEGNFILRGVDSKIVEAGKLGFESSGSEVKIGTVNLLQLNSRNDKYDIDKVVDIIGEGSFTDLKLDNAEQNVRLDFNYGDIFITRVNKDFDQIILNGKSCDINMILNQASYIKTKIVGASDNMILPNIMLGMHTEDLEDEMISLEGYVGNTNTKSSDLNITSRGGKLIISIKETDFFTNRD